MITDKNRDELKPCGHNSRKDGSQMKEEKAKRGRKALYNEPSVKRFVILPEKLVEAIEKSGSLSLYLAKAAEGKAKRDKLI